MSFTKTRKEKCKFFNNKLKEEQNNSILQIKSDINKTQIKEKGKGKINKKQIQKIDVLKRTLRDYTSSYKRPNKVKFGTHKIREFDKNNSPSELENNQITRKLSHNKITLKSILKHKNKNKNKNKRVTKIKKRKNRTIKKENKTNQL